LNFDDKGNIVLEKKEERKNLDFNKKKLERPKFDSRKDDKIKEWNVKKDWKTEKGMQVKKVSDKEYFFENGKEGKGFKKKKTREPSEEYIKK
jgi:hypothetical protein